MAGNSGAIRAGKAFVEIYADKSSLVRGLKAASRDVKEWGDSIVSVGKLILAAGAAGVLAFGAAAKVFADAGSALNDMSARTGASVEALSAIGYAAGQVGASIEDVEIAMKGLAKSGHGAGMGTAAAFRAGLKAISRVRDPLERARVAMKLFGKAGMQMIPLAMEFEALEARAKSLGIVMSTADAEAADKLGDAWDDLLAVGKSITVQIGAAIAPVLQSVAEFTIMAATAVNRFVKDNRALVDILFTVVSALSAAGVVITAVGLAVIIFGEFLEGAVAILAFVGGAIALIASPIGLIVSALAIAGVAFVAFTDAGRDAIQYLLEQFETLQAGVMKTLKGIADALAAGNLALAVRVLWAAIGLAWQTGATSIQEAWSNALKAMFNAAQSIALSMTGVFIKAFTEIAKLMLRAQDMRPGAAKLTPDQVKSRDMMVDVMGAGLQGQATGAITGIKSGLDAGQDKAVAASRAKLTAAQKEFDDSTAFADREAKRAAAEAKKRVDSKKLSAAELDMEKTSTSGTFQGSIAGGLGAGSRLDEIASATKQTAKNTTPRKGMIAVS